MSVERNFSFETAMTLNSMAMEKLLNRIDRIGMSLRTQVSKSMPVMPMAASPQKFTHSLSGLATLAPMASARPYPKWVDLPQPMYDSGVTDCQNGESSSRGLPASWVTM